MANESPEATKAETVRFAPNLSAAMLSQPGGRDRNEDAAGFWSDRGVACFVLADGAGGHGGGDIASRAAVSAVLERFMRSPRCDIALVTELMETANAAVLMAQRQEPRLREMRSTLVILLVDPLAMQAVWGHVGDSRLYHFRETALIARTRDHSLYQAMIDAGFAGSDERNLPSRNALLYSLGSAESFVPEVPDQSVPLAGGDAFLLCSDGFWDGLDVGTIASALRDSRSTSDWLRHSEAALLGTSVAQRDNYSAIAIRLATSTGNAGSR